MGRLRLNRALSMKIMIGAGDRDSIALYVVFYTLCSMCSVLGRPE